MPKLITNTYRKLNLPSTKDAPEEEKAWVRVKDRLNGGDWLGSMVGKDNAERTILSLAGFIVEWNMEDDNGQIAEINGDTVSRLEVEDIGFLSIELQQAIAAAKSSIVDDQKKTSSSTSTPSIPGVNPT